MPFHNKHFSERFSSCTVDATGGCELSHKETQKHVKVEFWARDAAHWQGVLSIFILKASAWSSFSGRRSKNDWNKGGNRRQQSIRRRTDGRMLTNDSPKFGSFYLKHQQKKI